MITIYQFGREELFKKGAQFMAIEESEEEAMKFINQQFYSN